MFGDPLLSLCGRKTSRSNTIGIVMGYGDLLKRRSSVLGFQFDQTIGDPKHCCVDIALAALIFSIEPFVSAGLRSGVPLRTVQMAILCATSVV